MRKRIRQLARGKFEYVKPTVEFSEETISIHVVEGVDYTGSFGMICTNHQKFRGIIYSTNERMECLTPQFEGDEVKIRYCFHSKGLTEEDVSGGEFLIVCNGCEYSLAFDVTITRIYPDSSIGKIQSLQDFASLAREKWEEAFQLFYHKSFSNIFKQKEEREAMIYRGIMASRPSNQNLEEFLIGIGKKHKISISLEEDSQQFRDVDESIRETLHLNKDSWGYLSVSVSADAPFIRLEKSRITTEDFLGSGCSFHYMIDANQLHSGKNYARICFETVYQKLEVSVMVNNQFDWVPSDTKKQIQECKLGIMELYQAYRLKRMVTGVWANETVEILNHLHALEPMDPIYVLMKAQVYIINRQRQEAEWILDEFKRIWEDKMSPVWGYYLYLLTLMEREPAYVDRMTREIEVIFHENPDSVLLFWVLSFLEERYYNNSQEKLKAIEYWVKKGCSSPYLYLEAYYLFTQEPYLLRRFGIFEIRILRWAIKMRCLSKDLASQIFQIIEISKEFDPVLYRILCAAYEVNPKPEYIGIICSYLIKGQQYETRYHDWFEKGIELEFRITGLYEAYLLSLDERALSHVPQIIQMYFQYESKLPYKKMAVLYNNIIAAREEAPEMYAKYRKTMGRFAMEQVEQGHMDDNLAVVYTDMLDLGLINKDIARCLSRILFTHKLYVFDSGMVRAWIYQRQLKEPQIVPIVEHTGYFQVYSQDYVILLEDAKGRKFSGSIFYEEQNLMNPAAYLEKCISLAPNEIPYIISYFDKNHGKLNFSQEDEVFFNRLVYAKELSPEYKAGMISEILRYYRNRKDGEEFIYSFIREVDIASLSVQDRKFLFELMIEHRMYEHAYELIRDYGIDQIGASARVTLASNLIESRQEEEDDFLTALAYGAFCEGKYNDRILQYLCENYVGPTEQMYHIWKASNVFELDTFELEERILCQMMYADRILPDIDPLFAKYYENGGREMVVMAYLTLLAHSYFVDGRKTEQLVFDILESRYLYHMELNDTCRLALLKYLSVLRKQTKAQYQMLDELLSEFTRRNMFFAFYKKLDSKLIQKYHLYDKVILEYRTEPGKHVVLHYSRDEDGSDFIAEDMADVYDGIYVKQFVMFFGEMIQYYISEEQDNQVQVTESNRLTNQDVYNQKDDRRYSLINQMLISNSLMEQESLREYMERYQELEELTRHLFHCL